MYVSCRGQELATLNQRCLKVPLDFHCHSVVSRSFIPTSPLLANTLCNDGDRFYGKGVLELAACKFWNYRFSATRFSHYYNTIMLRISSHWV